MTSLDATYMTWMGSGWEQPDPFLREVTSYAYRRVVAKCREHAEDISQMTALYVWKHITAFDPARSSISNWVRMTADSVLNDYLQDGYKRSGTIEFDPNLNELHTSQCGLDFDIDATEKLVHAFGSNRELLNLLLSGKSEADCARELGLSRKAIRHRMDKARKRAQSYSAVGAIS
jgi:DNA-directed RNA polymerase specialized sigma24 family protein